MGCAQPSSSLQPHRHGFASCIREYGLSLDTLLSAYPPSLQLLAISSEAFWSVPLGFKNSPIKEFRRSGAMRTASYLSRHDGCGALASATAPLT